MRLTPIYYLLTFCIAATTLWACTKGSDTATAASDTALLNVIDAVTDIRAIDLYLNGTRQNNTSAIYLNNTSGYLAVPAGEQSYQFKSDTDRTVLADIKLNPAKKDSSYTLVLAGQQSKNNLAQIFIDDHFPGNSVTTNAQVRFVQASPGTTSYDVSVGDTLAFKNQAYKAFTSFQAVGAGKKYVRIRTAGTTSVIKLDSVIIQASHYYTLIIKGVQGGTGNNALGTSINLSR